MQLSRPFSLRLSPDLLQWLDHWRGDRMSRGTAIRLLLEQSMRLHRDGILPANNR
jgi:predicted DNA-binding protein